MEQGHPADYGGGGGSVQGPFPPVAGHRHPEFDELCARLNSVSPTLPRLQQQAPSPVLLSPSAVDALGATRCGAVSGPLNGGVLGGRV